MALRYKIVLYKTPIDLDGIDTVRFKTEAEQLAYFNQHIVLQPVDTVNFNFRDCFNTSQYVNVITPDLPTFDTIFAVNYLKAYNIENPNEYYYYHVLSLRQDAGTMFEFELELDCIQTHLFRSDVVIQDSIVTRSHIDRFAIPSLGLNEISFDYSVNSRLFKSEGVQNLPLYIKDNLPLIRQFNDDSLINAMLNVPWVYFFFNAVYIQEQIMENQLTIAGFRLDTLLKVDDMYTPYYVLGCPLNGFDYLRSKKFVPDTIDTMTIEKTFQYINTVPELSGSFMGVLVSNLAPNIGDTFNETNNGRLYFRANWITTPTHFTYPRDIEGITVIPAEVYLNSSFPSEVLYTILQIKVINSVRTNVISQPFEFTKNEIINGDEDISHEPKLFMQPYMNINIRNRQSNGQTYDSLKLGENFSFDYFETIEPASNKVCYRLVLSDEVEKAYTSAFQLNNLNAIHVNNLLPYYQSEIGKYIAQNANYVRQSLTIPNAQSLISGASNAFSGAVQSNPLAVGTTVLNTGVDVWARTEQFNMSIDNMRKAPNTVLSLGNNVMFDINTRGFDGLVEIEELLPVDKIFMWQQFLRKGYATTIVDNPLNLIFSRKRYNYIEAQLGVIKGNLITNQVRNKLRELFARGIRFWNPTDADIFNYTLSNYEISLES